MSTIMTKLQLGISSANYMTFFLHVQSKLEHQITGAILRVIGQQRNGETINLGLVKKVVDSFVCLGLDESDINKASLDVYKEHCENAFIDATEKYYVHVHEPESFLAESSVSDCLVERRIGT
jgi:cullin 1